MTRGGSNIWDIWLLPWRAAETMVAANSVIAARSQVIRDSWTHTERGLDQVHLQQMRRLQERAQLAEERLPAVSAPAVLGEPGVGAGSAYLRTGRSEQGVAVMGLDWSGDGRTL